MATVLLVDDDPRYRLMLSSFLDASFDLAVVGAAGDGEEAIALAEELRPDAVVVDLAMPGLDGVDVATRIRAMLPEAVILFVTGMADGDEHRRALELGIGEPVEKGDPLPVENALRRLTRR